MKVKYSFALRPWIVLMGFLLLMLPVELKAQFEWLLSTNEGDDISVELIGYSGTGGYVDIPATYNGYPVTDIGNSAFLNQSNITSVTMPNSVATIDDGADQCKKGQGRDGGLCARQRRTDRRVAGACQGG